MKYRRLANTGVYVSELCLGAMTFGGQWPVIGALGQPEADQLVHRSAGRGCQFFRYRQRLFAWGLGADPGQGARPQAARGDPGHQGAHPDGTGPQSGRPLAVEHSPGGRSEPDAAGHRLHRPLPDSQRRPGHTDRGDAGHPHGPRACRQGCATSAARTLRRGSSCRRSGSPDSVGSRSSRPPSPTTPSSDASSSVR